MPFPVIQTGNSEVCCALKTDESGRNRERDSLARTHLANERTFLAWIRTGAALIALGLAAAQFLARGLVPGLRLVTILAIIMVIVGMLVVVIGAQRYLVGSKEIEAHSLRPIEKSVSVITALLLIIGMLALVFVYLAREPGS
jgi:putative membrane protein